LLYLTPLNKVGWEVTLIAIKFTNPPAIGIRSIDQVDDITLMEFKITLLSGFIVIQSTSLTLTASSSTAIIIRLCRLLLVGLLSGLLIGLLLIGLLSRLLLLIGLFSRLLLIGLFSTPRGLLLSRLLFVCLCGSGLLISLSGLLLIGLSGSPRGLLSGLGLRLGLGLWGTRS